LMALVSAGLAWRCVQPLAHLRQAALGQLAGEGGSLAAQPALPADLADIAEALRRSRLSRDRHRDELQAVLDHANVGLALTRDARIDIVNRQFCADLGYQREQVVGQSPRLVYASDEAYEAFARVALPALHQHGLVDTEVQLARRDGSRFWARMMGRAVVPGDRSAGFIWVMSDITRERDQRDRLQWAASHDRLTGLLNRAAFEALLDEACLHAAQAPFCLLYIDLDRFKQVNDTGGHAAGDALLRGLVAELGRRLRKSDTLARLGGDEFAVILPGCPVPQAQALAERLRCAVETYRLGWDGHQFEVGASIGLVAANGLHASAEDVLRQADAACYQAKQAGRNQVALSAGLGG